MIYVLMEGRADAAAWFGPMLNFDRQTNSIQGQLFKFVLSKPACWQAGKENAQDIKNKWTLVHFHLFKGLQKGAKCILC